MAGHETGKAHEYRAKALEKRIKVAYRNLKKTNSELRNRIEQLSALHRISLAMRDSATNPQRLWEMMLEEAIGLLRADSGAIFLADHDGTLKVQSAKGICAENVRNLVIPVGRGIIGYVAEHGEAVLVPDVSKEPRYRMLIEGIQSEMAAPMIGGQSIIGVINVESRKLGAFDPSDKELLMTLASHAAKVWENAMLYQMAQQRNTQLLESYEQLREAQSMLIKQERLAALGEMSAIVAHEIRNPMTAIRGFAQRTGRRLSGDATAKKYSEIIISEVDRLDKVIKSVLDFAKKSVLQKQPSRIETIIDDALVLLDDQVRRRSITVHRRIAGRLPEAVLDPHQMKQVAINLLQNAVDVTPEGQAIIVEAVLDGRDLRLSIIDKGRGIDPELVEKIFEPFFSTKLHGTGLGLAMAQRIVEEHGGTIDVANVPGGGAAFTVRLPLQNSATAPSAPIAKQVAAPAKKSKKLPHEPDASAAYHDDSRPVTKTAVSTSPSGPGDHHETRTGCRRRRKHPHAF